MSVWIRKLLILLVIVAVVLPFALRGIRYYEYQRQMEQLVIGEIHPERFADGIYSGSKDVVVIQAKVEVAIAGGRIQDIQLLEHRHTRGERAEGIVLSVVEAQSLQVDTVSGATDSSKVILKAIGNALSE